MNYAIIDSRTPEDVKAALIREGFGIIPLPAFPALSAPVASHPDMLIFFGDGIYCHRDYYAIARKELDTVSSVSGLPIITSDEPVSDVYPGDVLFNAAKVGNRIVCRTDKCSALISEYAARTGKTLVNVKQGYSKCSLLPISENAVITADAGIAKALSPLCDVLVITPGHVVLDGCGYGFIGGASGVFGDKICFCGNVGLHPDAERIDAFCRAHGKMPVSLGTSPLTDIGTIFFI